jgi:YfiH family protein
MSKADERLSALASRHLFSGRHGGVSDGCYKSLNVGYGVGDSPEHVRDNRKIIKQQAGVKVLVGAHQVHGNRVEIITGEAQSDRCTDGVDALITNRRGIGLMVQLADCQGILVHDPERAVVAAIHCGWRGSVAGVIGNTVRQMHAVFGSTPDSMVAFVSPSLGPCCAEFIHYQKELPREFHSFQVKPNYFDFWKISRQQLNGAGLSVKNIHISAICTSCSNDYFSYRRACRNGDGRTGRHCAVISLRLRR